MSLFGPPDRTTHRYLIAKRPMTAPQVVFDMTNSPFQQPRKGTFVLTREGTVPNNHISLVAERNMSLTVLDKTPWPRNADVRATWQRYLDRKAAAAQPTAEVVPTQPVDAPQPMRDEDDDVPMVQHTQPVDAAEPDAEPDEEHEEAMVINTQAVDAMHLQDDEDS